MSRFRSTRNHNAELEPVEFPEDAPPHFPITQWVNSTVWGEPVPVYTPLLGEQARAALDKAEAVAAARRRPRAGRQPRQCTLTSGYSTSEQHGVPRLRLEGKWMEALGFTVGGRADISVQDGALVIVPVRRPAPAPRPSRHGRAG